MVVLLAPACSAPLIPEFEPGQVRVRAPSDNPCLDCVELFGQAGSVDPAGGEVVLTGLDGELPAVRVSSASADGAFTGVVGPAGMVRVSVRSDDVRGAPRDFFATRDDPTLRPVPEPIGSCFEHDPEIDFGTVPVGTVVEDALLVVNTCSFRIDFATSTVRERTAPVEIIEDIGDLNPASSATLNLRLEVLERGPIEATVFLQTVTPQPVRRPVTLHAVGREPE